MLEDVQRDQLVRWREQTADYVRRALQMHPPVIPLAQPDKHRYRFSIDDKAVRVPRKSGLYVIYSTRTHHPLYVAHCEVLKLAMLHELNPAHDTLFKKRWLRAWLSLPRERRLTREEALRLTDFICTYTYFKYLYLPFGRAEIAEELIIEYGIKGGPNTINPQAEFALS